jgi:orotate phosphoribosyltransferase
LRAVRDAGGHILGILALVDREEGGRQWIEREKVRVTSMFRASELKG